MATEKLHNLQLDCINLDMILFHLVSCSICQRLFNKDTWILWGKSVGSVIPTPGVVYPSDFRYCGVVVSFSGRSYGWEPNIVPLCIPVKLIINAVKFLRLWFKMKIDEQIRVSNVHSKDGFFCSLECGSAWTNQKSLLYFPLNYWLHPTTFVNTFN